MPLNAAQLRVCCTASVAEAELALAHGADALDEGALAQMRAWTPHADALLLDSGTPCAAIRFLAGGLRAENVAKAERTVRPNGVDVCTGVRTDGVLDAEKLAAFTAVLGGWR